MPGQLELADHTVIVGYFALLTIVGLYFWKRVRHVRDLFVGNNRVPWWLAGISFYMTSYSAFMFVAYSEMAYRYGLIAVTLAFSAPVAVLVGTLALAPRWRRARIISHVQFLEMRYSTHIRQALAWSGLPLKVVDDGLKIYATGVFVSVGLGYDLETSIVASGVIMLGYTFLGGLWAVLVTDYVQFLVLTLAVVVLFPLAIARVDLGTLAAAGQPGFLSPINAPFSPLYVAAFYLLVLLGYNGNWALAQRFYSVPDERAARKAGFLAVALMTVGPPLFILPAVAARSLLPELMDPPNSPQYAYAMLAIRFLPAGLVGLMIAAMFAATMSTLSSDYNVMASVVTEDIYHRLIDRHASERRLMIVGRLATLAIGAVTIVIGVGLVAAARQGLFEVMVALFALFVGPMIIPLLGGLLTPRITARGAAAGIAAGFASGLAMYLYKTLVIAARPDADPTWLHYDFEALTILVNFALTTTTMIVTSIFDRRSAEEQARVDAFFARLALPIEPGVAPAANGATVFSPLAVVGWASAGTGLLLFAAAAVQAAGWGRVINVGVGAVLCLLGLGMVWLSRRLTLPAARPDVAVGDPVESARP
ncbi:MAG: hypothetical protein HYU53_13570 [Acidobacteria bacterium]|nr:hypothetical protein [Acidobacteriota bacterium]